MNHSNTNNLNSLKGLRILLGVTGSISAYKIPNLIRELQRAGATVRTATTESALKFVTEDTLHNISRHPVATEIFDKSSYNGGAWHVHLAYWCDIMLIAPCSANTLSDLASGAADSTVTALYLALPKGKKAIVSPAMDHDMYVHPATQRNLEFLKKDGTLIIEPEEGELSSGLIGKGRLPKDEVFIQVLSEANKGRQLNRKNNSKTVFITAGPTVEPIDDVRFISNYSSGKMGVALANEAAKLGLNVSLALGPVDKSIKDRLDGNIKIERFTTADELLNISNAEFDGSDILIFAAAVSDFKPIKQKGKIKKQSGKPFNINFEENPDILQTIATRNKSINATKKIIGFALESQNAMENAKAKLVKKGCDFLLLNKANIEGSGFEAETNTITILSANDDKDMLELPNMSKSDCAKVILEVALAE
ncbi:MAG: bifunctional phosphopantothenoylcysteine decarboxylase/phosphopantothenate--cysteine ligase CoaBC [Candidatus Kapaibacteriales bacterium]